MGIPLWFPPTYNCVTWPAKWIIHSFFRKIVDVPIVKLNVLPCPWNSHLQPVGPHNCKTLSPLICFVLQAIFSVLSGIKVRVNYHAYGSENTQAMVYRVSRLCCLVGYQRFGGIWGQHEVSCQTKQTGGKIFYWNVIESFTIQHKICMYLK